MQKTLRGRNFASILGLLVIGVAAQAGCSASAGGVGATLPDASGDFDSGGVVNPGPGPGPMPVVDSGSMPMDAGPGMDAADSAPADPIGFPCTTGATCASGSCQDVLGGGAKICVTACVDQSECPLQYFCDPTTAGAAAGFCVPRSASHCKACATNADCGSLSEVCGIAAGDNTNACHVDCTIAGNAACPSDYSCQSTTVDGASRMICKPNSTAFCLDALGGFCDRVTTDQACVRATTNGTCGGFRTCNSASKRFGACGAPAPQCISACSEGAPNDAQQAGCHLTSFCGGAAVDIFNCGTCGNVCPGAAYASTTANVTCGCTFSCRGENYDTNNNALDGCETADSAPGHHASTDTAPTNNPNPGSCADDSSGQNFGGDLPSDGRGHANASIGGFIAAGGYASDWWHIQGGGGATCYNDIGMTLHVNSPTGHANCYGLHIQTDRYGNTDCTTDGSGNCTASRGGGSLPCGVWPLSDCDPAYSNNTGILLQVFKTCDGVHEAATYTVSGHL